MFVRYLGLIEGIGNIFYKFAYSLLLEIHIHKEIIYGK